MKSILLGLAAAAAVMGAAASASADSYAFGYSYDDGNEYLTVDGTSIGTNGFQGWVSDTAGNVAGPDGNTNYITGSIYGSNYNNYFVFDISGLSGTVSSASLTLSAQGITDNLTYRLGDATAEASSLYDAVSPNPGLYAALGSGTNFGSFSVTPGESYSTLTFNLNSAGVSALNSEIAAGDHYFALGGTVNPGVPEPATWTLMILGMGGLGLGLRGSRRRSAVVA